MVADALYIVKDEELTDAVTWVPDLPSSGTYQVYAKWTADETRATDARYSVVHEGGTAEVSVNQRAAGGLWQYLGSYAFDPLSTPTVTLAANDNGSVAADAVRFVGGPGGATDIAYLHSDHLGTPQVMTDANAQVLWWRDQTPFGQTVAEGGFSVSPLRFPGQYADTESGLAYNYFRDYDPALGRYIQSDPIGLRGGLNTFGYVMGNPVRLVDMYGLAPGDKLYGLPKAFWKWYHIVCKKKGDPDLPTREAAEEYYQEWLEEGSPGPDSKRRRGRRPGGGGRGTVPLIIFPGQWQYTKCLANPNLPECQTVEVPQISDCQECENDG